MPTGCRVAAEREPGAAGAPWVLVVEDEPLIAVTLRDDLEDHGYRVVSTGDGARALQLLDAQAFVAVVTDLRLPGVDGGVVVQAARAHDRHLRVLVISAHFDGQEERLTQAGAEACLRKPFANQAVVDWLRAGASPRVRSSA